MSVSLHPHEEARRKAWVEFVVASTPVAMKREERFPCDSPYISIRNYACYNADELLKEYDKRFTAPWEDDNAR